MLCDLLVQHLVRETILVDTVDEIGFAYVVDSCLTAVADYCLLPKLAVLYYFLQSEHLVLAH